MTTINENTILYLDDDQINLDVFEASFHEYYNILTTTDSQAALEILKNNEVKVVITDQRMPDLSGIEFIQQAQPANPDAVFVMLTAFPDNEVLLSSINKTKLFRFMIKPWKEFDMKQTIDSAIEVYNSKIEKQKLILDLQIAKDKAQESDRLKSAFLSNISHEIRTPLNGILGFMSMLDEQKADIDNSRAYREMIKKSSDRLLTILSNIVKMSEIQSKHVTLYRTKFNLTALFDNLTDTYNSLIKDVSIETKYIGIENQKELYVSADKNKLNEIFIQLINNSFKYTKNGSIEIGMIHKEECVFYVKDTGIGIRESEMNQIFQIFSKGNSEDSSIIYEGIGMGLAIVKSMVEIQGGKIWLESEKGKGSTFYFTVPLKLINHEKNTNNS